MPSILLIEDDGALANALSLALSDRGHDVQVEGTGSQGLSTAMRTGPDVVLLDLMLPDVDGLDICRLLHRAGHPVILLTAKDSDDDVVAGLNAGADDYVSKPAEAKVLDARIRAVLRRAQPPVDTEDQQQPPTSLAFGNLVLDRVAYSVSKHGEPIRLSPTESRLLFEISKNPGQVFTRDELLSVVWGKQPNNDSRLVDACIHRLRSKLEENPGNPRYIQTVSGAGYRFGPL